MTEKEIESIVIRMLVKDGWKEENAVAFIRRNKEWKEQHSAPGGIRNSITGLTGLSMRSSSL